VASVCCRNHCETCALVTFPTFESIWSSTTYNHIILYRGSPRPATGIERSIYSARGGTALVSRSSSYRKRSCLSVSVQSAKPSERGQSAKPSERGQSERGQRGAASCCV
jgi:hypothetical protein